MQNEERINSFNKITHINFFIHYLLCMLVAFAPFIYLSFPGGTSHITEYGTWELNNKYSLIGSAVWMLVIFCLFFCKHKSSQPGIFGLIAWGASALVVKSATLVLFKNGAIFFSLGWIPSLFVTYFIGVYVTKFTKEDSFKPIVKTYSKKTYSKTNKGCLMIIFVVLIALFILIRFK